MNVNLHYISESGSITMRRKIEAKHGKSSVCACGVVWEPTSVGGRGNTFTRQVARSAAHQPFAIDNSLTTTRPFEHDINPSKASLESSKWSEYCEDVTAEAAWDCGK